MTGRLEKLNYEEIFYVCGGNRCDSRELRKDRWTDYVARMAISTKGING